MALTPTETRELLARLGHTPRRRLGQNFLVDGNIVRKSLELAQLAPGDCVVEVGPGLGTLTSALLGAGATVWAVERDRALFAHLASALAGPALHLMEGDAVEAPLAGLPDALAPSAKVVANLPYAISTPWMDAVLSGPLPCRMVLMLQREAAERYCASPGTGQFGAISIFLQAAYDAAPGHRVSAACFHPRPEVDSVLLNLVRKQGPHVFGADDKRIVRRCFQQRRKQLLSVMREVSPADEPRWGELLASRGFPMTIRAEAVPVDVWIRLLAGRPHA
ncbi:MAG TPA: 16S rRNA (adenine(1518)-N(6)/adenine(1519)-N(6))-dimethyltransferase RsmA [Opitutaceae bacterium]|jgi:16S rRNA (adenine1518-N6/adenine1519-N6)-dimethyltransferase